MGLSWLLYSSLTGSVMVGLILIAKRVFRNVTGAGWQYAIWFLLLGKLLVPFAPESPVSVFNLFHHIGYLSVMGREVIGQVDGKNLLPAGRSQLNADLLKDYALVVGRGSAPLRLGVLFWIWLTGALALAAYRVVLYFRLKGWRPCEQPVNDAAVIELLAECQRTLNFKGKIVLIESSLVRSPGVVGALRPHLFLPSGAIGGLSRSELRFVFLHELAHLKRKDLYVNWLTAVLQAIHWFNPLIWYAFDQMRQDRELACDAWVLARIQPSEYQSYGLTLIALVERYMAAQPALTGLVGGKARFKQRIALIAAYQKGSTARTAWGIMLLMTMGFLVLTNAQGAPKVPSATGVVDGHPKAASMDLSRFFKGYDGAFVLFDREKGRYQIYNAVQSQQRVSPDSTYKIISALVGLESGALQDANTRLKWDGTRYPIQPWNGDQTLASAIKYSVNWFFQQTDANVGAPRIQKALEQIGYGNCDLSGGQTEFWMESSLQISPLEQVEVLKKLSAGQMPFSRRNIAIVKDVLKLSEQGNVRLYGKTGTGIVKNGRSNGWFVGWVENAGRVSIFAAHIQGKQRVDGAHARQIALAILRSKHLL